eukprot:1113184-Alexandrium_andersonii.AAC.1
MVRPEVELEWPLEWHALLLVGSLLAGLVVGRLGSARAGRAVQYLRLGSASEVPVGGEALEQPKAARFQE